MSIIISVLKNQYLFKKIINYQRDEYKFLDVSISKNIKTHYRYDQILLDLVWVIKNKHWNLLRFILQSPLERSKVSFKDLFFPQNKLILSMTSIDNLEIINLLLSTYQLQFIDYFTFNNNNNNNIKRPLKIISDYFLNLISNHGNLEIWNSFINFFNYK
ncbi:hypothetical protein DFA_08256 [Cavenderia fasciculata]|uniref:Uncharacterized protein n=1 Tax=Cavenderia fasciculata TaxID=261658 RepID=F4Q5K6_CACFS|nr:uncharacterized protein DFA_08256 [Cavenderia fasciculata]EGG17265.1 hypothetical protein DFA_08256 [Cavenderia fasciculata]|eukprot:XP_004355749.1 hypothetical protein DFA_08256 [Cavenderia fasciculata]